MLVLKKAIGYMIRIISNRGVEFNAMLNDGAILNF